MNVVPVISNTPEWLAVRAKHDTASEAPAALGESKYTSRTELLNQKATGLVEEVGAAKQAIFDRGHKAEAQARLLAEAILDTELYPVTATLTVDGIDLLASLDGASMDEQIIWEHKLFSEKLAADVRAGTLDPHYTIQLDQQLLVSGAKKCMFMTSDGTADKMAWCWYEASPQKFAALVAGWKQFRSDLADYAPMGFEIKPVGKAPETLPALNIQVTGMVTGSNLDVFKTHAMAVFKSINRNLTTDSDFANAEQTVKWCGDVESRLEAAKQHALSQTESIDALFRAINDISAEARQVRLDLSKLVAARKVSLKTELLTDAQTALREHVAALNNRLGRAYMPAVTADFAAAIHGKKNFDSMRAALNAALANAKIETNATADRIQANLATLRELAAVHEFLFADTSTIVLKACDDLTALVKTRIAEHAATELAKEEATRERIRVEEEAKATAKVLAEQAAAAAAQKAADDAAAKALADKQAADDAAELAAQQAAAVVTPISEQKEALAPTPRAEPAIETIASAPNVVSIVRPPAVAPATPPTLKLGQIGERLGFNLTGDFLNTLGFEPAARDKSALLFLEASFPLICAALVAHIEQVQAKQAA